MRQRIFLMLIVFGAGMLTALAIQPREHTASALTPPPSHDVIGLAVLAFQQPDDPAASSQVRGATQSDGGNDVRTSTRNQRAGVQQTGGEIQLTAEMIVSCLQVARDIDPELGEQLAQQRVNSPGEFEQTMQQEQVGRRLWAMVQLKHRDPDLYRLKTSEIAQSLQINRVAARLHEAMQKADEATIRTLRTQLREALQLQFAMSLKARCEYLARIEEQVKKLHEEIEYDAANFHSIVDSRLQYLIDNPPRTDAAAVIPATTSNRP